MKLSEAILKGCEQHPRQVTRRLMQHDKNGMILGTCVIGAALVGIFGNGEFLAYSSDEFQQFEQMFPILKTRGRRCPECKIGMVSIRHVLEHLNDTHGWTRESIAHWWARHYEDK